MANKVEFGISQLHVGTYTVSNGTVTLGTPYHQAGAVSFSPEESSEQNTFYADNIAYWSGYSGGSIEGDLEVAMFDDAFKTQFLGYATLTNGGLANVKNATKPNVYKTQNLPGSCQITAHAGRHRKHRCQNACTGSHIANSCGQIGLAL